MEETDIGLYNYVRRWRGGDERGLNTPYEVSEF